MRLGIGSIDHQLIGLSALGSELSKNPVQLAQADSADEAIIDRFVGCVANRRIMLGQPVPDHDDDAVHDPAIIGLQDAERQGKVGFGPTYLSHARQPQIQHGQLLLGADVEFSNAHRTSDQMGPRARKLYPQSVRLSGGREASR